MWRTCWEHKMANVGCVEWSLLEASQLGALRGIVHLIRRGSRLFFLPLMYVSLILSKCQRKAKEKRFLETLPCPLMTQGAVPD